MTSKKKSSTSHPILTMVANLQDLEAFQEQHWQGTLADYLSIVQERPAVARNAFQRLYDMVMGYGTQEYVDCKKRIIRYKFFDDPFDKGKDGVFGIDVYLQRLMNVLKGAAHGYGTQKRVVLLHGPVGSAKSTIVRLFKKGLEFYSKTADGALYTYGWKQDGGVVMWCPMNEDPLRLIPLDLRDQVVTQLNAANKGRYPIQLEGDLCPVCRYMYAEILKECGGDWTQLVDRIVVKRLMLSERDRVGIGTFQPKDEKNQDSTELTGDINYRKIAEYGSDSDPRAFNFDGEFNIANRGLVEFIEVLKLDVAFLYDLLGASQEHSIKPKKFPQTHIDEVIIGHTNEPEYRKFQTNEFMEALRDRTIRIDVPYITTWKNESRIYSKDFNDSPV